MRYNLHMSWASRRRTSYTTGVILFFAVVIGGPLMYWYLSVPPTCSDGIQNQGETSVDKGGPCFVLDEKSLQPYALLWSRSFRVRDGSYNAVAYIQNPNKEAGVRSARYRFGLYDARNVLIAEREGIMYIMPGATTPVIEARIDAGNRIVAHTYFEFTEPFTWERMKNNATAISVSNKDISSVAESPRLSALAQNSSVVPLTDISFVAVVFDPAGNAFTASATSLSRLDAGEASEIVFTWPDPFAMQPSRLDVIPIVAPSLLTAEDY